MGILINVVVGLICLVAGLALGAWIVYICFYKPLCEDRDALVQTLVYMKRQGFVPQFEVEQAIRPDLAAHIREF